MARPASESALASASEIASSASRAASSSDWPCARRVCSASSSAHSSAPGASFATSPICQASRSRSRSRSPCFSRASASDWVAARQADQSAASGAASICACASSRARTAGARVSPCQACWPWMSTSRSAASRSCAIVAPLPLIHARLLPWASIVRRSSMRPASPASASKPASASHGASAGGTSNSALTSARAAPFAHDAGVAAAAERELERVDQDRLAGAGLAAQHRQPRRELDLERVDDDEVADRETVQHG